MKNLPIVKHDLDSKPGDNFINLTEDSHRQLQSQQESFETSVEYVDNDRNLSSDQTVNISYDSLINNSIKFNLQDPSQKIISKLSTQKTKQQDTNKKIPIKETDA